MPSRRYYADTTVVTYLSSCLVDFARKCMPLVPDAVLLEIANTWEPPVCPEADLVTEDDGEQNADA